MAKQLPTTTNKVKGFGKLHQVVNLDPKFGSSQSYHRVLVKNEKGVFETLMLTHGDLQRIRNRASKNPEEHLSPTFFDRLRAL